MSGQRAPSVVPQRHLARGFTLAHRELGSIELHLIQAASFKKHLLLA